MAKKSNMLDIIKGISHVAHKLGHDGALDDKGEPVKIGLKREEGHPILDSRVMDGFQVQFVEDKLCIQYHSEITLRDVHAKGFESDIDSMIKDIAKFLRKEYKTLTGNALTLTPVKGEDLRVEVESLSRVRSWVKAKRLFTIGGASADEIRADADGDPLDASIRKFLELGKKSPRPENEEIKPKDNEKKEK